MIPFKHILAVTDLSECSLPAVEAAVALAQSCDARLFVLHVVTEPLHETWACYAPGADFIDAVNALEVRAKTRIEAALAGLGAPPATVAATWGDPSDEILKYARGCGADVILCGTHGRRGWKRLLMGSVAERLVRLANCPVLTVPPGRLLTGVAA